MYKNEKLLIADAEKYSKSEYEQDIRKKLAEELYAKYEPKIDDLYDFITIMEKLELAHVTADDRQLWARIKYNYPWALNIYLGAERRMKVLEDTMDMLEKNFEHYNYNYRKGIECVDTFDDAYKMKAADEYGLDYENDSNYELIEDDFKKGGI